MIANYEFDVNFEVYITVEISTFWDKLIPTFRRISEELTAIIFRVKQGVSEDSYSNLI
jgi:hypothetical protein